MSTETPIEPWRTPEFHATCEAAHKAASGRMWDARAKEVASLCSKLGDAFSAYYEGIQDGLTPENEPERMAEVKAFDDVFNDIFCALAARALDVEIMIHQKRAS